MLFRAYILVLFLLVTACWHAAGQDRATEIKFHKLRNQIRQHKIAGITEMAWYGWRTPCLKDSAEVTISYSFDEQGDLIQINEYDSGNLIRTTNYRRNEHGDFIAKSYLQFDSAGILKWRDNWILEFNDEGQRIKETWKRDDEDIRVNILAYDSSGYIIKQLTDSLFQWTFLYDEKGNLIERREWQFEVDAFICNKLTTYQYKGALLVSEVTQSPEDSEVWSDVKYEYDADGNLILITEMKTYWVNGRREIRVIRTKIENDSNGNPLTKSLYLDKDDIPFRCFFYNYLYRGN